MPQTNRFNQVPGVDLPRSTFNMDHRLVTTLDVDYIYPIFAQETLPGDSFNVQVNAFGRLNTPIFPIMDNLIAEMFFFEVQDYMVWDNAKRFYGERFPDPDTTIDLTQPQFSAHVPALGSLSDYFGIPTADQLGANTIQYNSKFHRGYNMIWREWFRDENLQDSPVVDTDDGPDDIADYVLLKANKKHDYFTSCLPNPQKGTAVALPLGSTAPVIGIGSDTTSYTYAPGTIYETGGSASTSYSSAKSTHTSQDIFVSEDANNTGYPGIFADLTNATAATINDWREAVQIQVLLERDMRGGTRYPEIIESHFGVNPPQLPWRPIYLNGNRGYVQFNSVAQTSSTDATSPKGDLSAVGTFNISAGFTKSFDCHGFVLGLLVVRADLTYSQGISRMWTRQTRYDTYWPAFAMLGEQEVLNQELYMQGTSADTQVFGYQERHAEYRYCPNRLTGLMRPNATGTLAAWNLSENFGSLPTLSNTFIQSNTPVDRVVALTSQPDFICDMWFNFTAARPMPVRAIPAGLSRF